jgi:hypothetical protein
MRAENSIIPRPAIFVKHFLEKNCTNFFPKLCAICLLCFKDLFVIIYLQVKESDLKEVRKPTTARARQTHPVNFREFKNSKKFKKTIDNLIKKEYNKYVR